MRQGILQSQTVDAVGAPGKRLLPQEEVMAQHLGIGNGFIQLCLLAPELLGGATQDGSREAIWLAVRDKIWMTNHQKS